jgi:hypothetical protein
VAPLKLSMYGAYAVVQNPRWRLISRQISPVSRRLIADFHLCNSPSTDPLYKILRIPAPRVPPVLAAFKPNCPLLLLFVYVGKMQATPTIPPTLAVAPTLTSDIELERIRSQYEGPPLSPESDQAPLSGDTITYPNLSKWKTFTIISTVTGITVLNSMQNGIVTVGLPTIGRDLGLSDSLILWSSPSPPLSLHYKSLHHLYLSVSRSTLTVLQGHRPCTP